MKKGFLLFLILGLFSKIGYCIESDPEFNKPDSEIIIPDSEIFSHSRWAQVRDIFQPFVDKEKEGDLQLDIAKELEREKEKIKEVIFGSTPLPKITGIMFSQDNENSAIIGNLIAKEGDFVDGFTVKKIGKNFVILKHGDEEHRIYVAP